MIRNIAFAFLLFFMQLLCAQESIVRISEPAEKSDVPVLGDKALLHVVSPIAGVTVENNITNDVASPAMPGKDETFVYEISLPISESERESGRRKLSRVVTVKSEYGNIDFSFRFEMGKCYEVRFDTRREFAYTDESFSGGIYASDKARVSFISKLDSLSLWYNDKSQPVFLAGLLQEQLPPNMTVSPTLEGFQIEFDLSGPHKEEVWFRRPVFLLSHCQDGEISNIEITPRQEMEIGPKANFIFRLYYKNLAETKQIVTVQKELTFGELLEKAQEQRERRDFEAAKNLYDDAMNATDCPTERKEEVRNMMAAMAKCRKYAYNGDIFIQKAANRRNQMGAEDDSVYLYLKGAYNCFRYVLKEIPNDELYTQKRDAAYEELKMHPLNMVSGMREVEVTKTKQVVKGKVVSKLHFGGIGGVPIYAHNSSEKEPREKDLRNITPIAYTEPDGTFNVVLENSILSLFFQGKKAGCKENFLLPLMYESKVSLIQLAQ